MASTTGKGGEWVGSSLIHLGDSNVPNSLLFIDKYSQIEHILQPILATLNALDSLHNDSGIARWMDSTWGGVAALRVTILADFFRYAFDGSGADNFFDAGSCIDGRMTSAWNWCSQLPSKPFYIVFKLAGFTSFDGQFQQ
uniref:Non-canonical E2 ubiquitin-conjugating enzyme C-terminal domain-containing protein n=1 Tax=Haptolina ericina TaxID=156174 RepID=A0A7S3BHB9_9EUKA